ncbi:ribonuclease III [Candidatus Saccharibacteria bacterium]|nr:ribonuclease III [Candidatus Saccharibacteria bacterium]
MPKNTTPNIYDIDFAVLDERKYQRVTAKTTPRPSESTQNGPDPSEYLGSEATAIEAVEEAQDGLVTSEPIGEVALASEIGEDPTILNVSKPHEITVDIPRPVEASPVYEPPYVPPEIMDLAAASLDAVLEGPVKSVIPAALLVDKAFGQKIPLKQFRQFKNALMQDSRLVYLGSGDFKIVGAEDAVVYWPGETPDVDMSRVEELSAEVLQAMEVATRYPDYKFSRLAVLGIAKSMGEYLTKDEENELFATLINNPSVTVHENGSLQVYKDFPVKTDLSEDGLRMVSLDFAREPKVREKPMTDKQVGRTMKDINRSVAVRKAADLAKRRANPRRRGKRNKKNKLQGRTHNKVHRALKLAAQMIEATSSPSVIPNITEVHEPDAVDSIEVDSLFDTSKEVPQTVVTPGTSPEKAQISELAKVSDYEAFAKRHFGEFPDMNLLITAFTHRSYLNENRQSALEHNERLEFLGDSILNAAVAEHLYRNYTDAEGMLTQWRTALTRNSTVSTVAEREGFEPLLRLSKGFRRHYIGYISSRKQILANCYEAVLGAVYLTQGNEAVKQFVETTLLPTLDTVMKDGTWKDPKSRLQALLQGNGDALPEYRVIHREGPDHNKVVVVGVYVKDKLVAEGAGNGSKEAQVAAAINALDVLLASYKEELSDPQTAEAN